MPTQRPARMHVWLLRRLDSSVQMSGPRGDPYQQRLNRRGGQGSTPTTQPLKPTSPYNRDQLR
jgi:hypothetical protein